MTEKNSLNYFYFSHFKMSEEKLSQTTKKSKTEQEEEEPKEINPDACRTVYLTMALELRPKYEALQKEKQKLENKLVHMRSRLNHLAEVNYTCGECGNKIKDEQGLRRCSGCKILQCNSCYDIMHWALFNCAGYRPETLDEAIDRASGETRKNLIFVKEHPELCVVCKWKDSDTNLERPCINLVTLDSLEDRPFKSTFYKIQKKCSDSFSP